MEKMDLTVEISDTDAEKVMIELLKADYEFLGDMMEPGLLIAILRVLQYYMTANDFEEWHAHVD